MRILYRFPEAAKFGKHIAKSRIYASSSSTKRVKKLFVSEVDKITWAYKLSPSTVNIPASGNIREIQVLSISLRTSGLSYEVLRAIDQSIPSPILFSLEYNHQTRYAAAYKRPSESDKTKWVIGSYFESEKVNNDIEETEVPIVFNLDELYHFYLRQLIPITKRKEESFRELIERAEKIKAMEQRAVKIESRVKREKQFNRKVGLNHELNKLNSIIVNIRKTTG